MSINELAQLSNRDFLAQSWNAETADKIFALIKNAPRCEKSFLNFFREDCIACGGDWGQTLLTGIKRKWPDIYAQIPNDLGILGWSDLCIILEELGVKKQ